MILSFKIWLKKYNLNFLVTSYLYLLVLLLLEWTTNQIINQPFNVIASNSNREPRNQIKQITSSSSACLKWSLHWVLFNKNLLKNIIEIQK